MDKVTRWAGTETGHVTDGCCGRRCCCHSCWSCRRAAAQRSLSMMMLWIRLRRMMMMQMQLMMMMLLQLLVLEWMMQLMLWTVACTAARYGNGATCSLCSQPCVERGRELIDCLL